MDIIINSFGALLSKDNGAFLIVTKDGKQRIPTEGVKSISINKGTSVTSDAIFLAIENEIDMLFVDKSGESKGRIWSNKYGSISTIRKGQVEFSFSKDAVEWIKSVVCSKIENQQALLLMMSVDEENKNESNKSIKRLEDYRNKIMALEGEIIPDISATLRGWEGVSSKIYFETLNIFLPESLKIDRRTQHPARDLLNCMLNYAYGILYSRIEGALIKSGIDPYIGVFHRDDYNRPVLVYDVIELYRIWADYIVYSLLIKNAVSEEYYSIKEDGSFWLESLGRRIVIQAMNDYLSEVIMIKGVSRSRLQQIQLYTQSLAQIFKNY